MAERKVFRKLLSVEDALKKLEENYVVKHVGREEINVEKSLGRVLSEDVVSMVDVPGFDSCLLYTSPSPRDRTRSRMPSSA